MRRTQGCLLTILMIAACGGDDTRPDPSASTITVDPPRMLADGRSRATVIVTLRDSDGAPLANEPVELTVDNTESTLSVTSGTTDELGVFVSSLSSTRSGEELVSASAGSARIAREVTLDPVAPACGFLLDTDVLLHVADVDKDGILDLLGGRGLLLGHGDGIFDPPLPGPPLASVGDIDGDGDLDAVDLNLSQGAIVYLGSGDGTFVATSVAPVSSPASNSLAIGDFDGDGADDAAFVTQGTERVVAVLASNGDGTLQAAVDTTIVYPLTFPMETGSILVLAADLDEDDRSDLVALGSGTTTIEVALANANGTFQAPTSVPRGTTRSLDFVATDLDGDGHIDLAGISRNPAEVSIFRGRGDGTFESPVVISSPSDIHTITAGDLDRDGQRDVVLGTDAGISFAHGNGDGTFGALGPVPGGERVGSTVVVGDFDGDGHDDLAAQVGGSGTMILLGDGQRFGPRTAQLELPAGLNPDSASGKIIDLDGDGHSDLVLSMIGASSSACGAFRGRGDGSFEPMVEVAPSYVLPFVFADFDRDGDRDLVGSVAAAATIDIYRNEVGTLTFAESLPVDLVNRDVAVADVNGDGRLDIVVVGIGNNSTMAVATFLSDGLGGFTDVGVLEIVSEPTNGPHGLAVGDLDGDGFSDVVTSSDRGISLLFGTAAGTFDDPIELESLPVTLAIEDVDDDGALDLVSGSNEITVRLNTGNRQLGAGLVYFPPDAANGLGAGALTLVDFDRDGILDIATATGLIGFGDGDGTFSRSERYPPFDAIGDLDHDGIVDLLSGLRVGQVCR